MTVCTVEVASIADTGAGAVLGWALAGLVVVVLGTALLVVRRRRVRRAAGAVVMLAALVALAVAGPQPAQPAQAAASDVVYSPGCSLIEIDEASVDFAPVTSSLLPGDRVTAITAGVDNRFAGAIELSGVAGLGTGSLAALLVTEVLFDGAPGPVTLAAGEAVVVTVVVTLPAHVDDTAQGETVDVDLVLTASEA